MADYIINFTDPMNGSFLIKPMTTNGPASPAAVTPLDPQATSANTSIVLLGKGMFEYGERVAESFVHMLEHFAFPTPPAYPIQGQIWFDNGTPGLFVYDGAVWNPILVGSFPIAGDLDMGGFKIENLGDPDSADDAVNLGFADTRYVNVTGDTMTGTLTVSSADIVLTGAGSQITLPNAPVAATDGVNKAFVDALTLDSLVDVIITVPVLNQLLRYNGVNWVNATVLIPSVLDDLSDVAITAPVVGDVLTFDGLVWINQAPAAFTDRYVTAGAMIGTTLQLSFSTAVPSPTINIAGIAPDGHTHLAPQVLYNTNQPDPTWVGPPPTYPYPFYNDSYLRELLITTATGYPNPQFPYGLNLQTIINTTDQALYQLVDIDRQEILQGDGATSLFTMRGQYLVGRNKVKIFNNGVKQYASQRAVLNVEFETQVAPIQSINVGSDTGLADGTYSFDIIVNGTLFTGVTAPTVTVAEDRDVTAVDGTGGPLGPLTTTGTTWTITDPLGDFADTLGIGTIFTVTGAGPGSGTYVVLTATWDGIGETDIVIDPSGLGVPGMFTTIPIGTTVTLGVTTLRKPYYFQQLKEDLDVSFVANAIPAIVSFYNSTLSFESEVVGTGSTVFYVPVANDLFDEMLTAGVVTPDFVYSGSMVSIDAADNTVSPDEFQVIGDYTGAFPTGVRFIVFGSIGNDDEYVTVANATFAAGFTTIYVTNGAISVNEASGAGTGDIFFERTLAYDEVGTPNNNSDQIQFTVAPATGDLIEVLIAP